MYWKKEKGKVVEGTGPMLYAKVLQNKKTDTITSLFYDENGRDIEPMSLLNKQCYVKAAIKIEGIFIGSKVSLQVKLHEAEIKLKDSGVKRLLRASLPFIQKEEEEVVVSSELSSLSLKNDEKLDENEEDDKGSLKGDDDEEEKVEEPTPPPVSSKAPVRRQAKK